MGIWSSKADAPVNNITTNHTAAQQSAPAAKAKKEPAQKRTLDRNEQTRLAAFTEATRKAQNTERNVQERALRHQNFLKDIATPARQSQQSQTMTCSIQSGASLFKMPRKKPAQMQLTEAQRIEAGIARRSGR